jgi:vacuolar-type H+-ATPase subunit B/Vma2
MLGVLGKFVMSDCDDMKGYCAPQYDRQSVDDLSGELCFVLNKTRDDHHEMTTQQMREYEKGQPERKKAGLGRLHCATARDEGCINRTGFSAKDPRADAAW